MNLVATFINLVALISSEGVGNLSGCQFNVSNEHGMQYGSATFAHQEYRVAFGDFSFPNHLTNCFTLRGFAAFLTTCSVFALSVVSLTPSFSDVGSR